MNTGVAGARIRAILISLFALLLTECMILSAAAEAQTLDEATLATKIEPPFVLHEQIDPRGIWTIRDLSGDPAGFVFQTRTLAPLPGFSGEPIDVLVTLDRDGKFLNAELLQHNEPIFVSGLGVAPFHEFMRQYRGLSIFDPLTVGIPYGAGDRDSSANVYLDGVTKATASVRIAHESILAASLGVVREQMQGIASGPAATPVRARLEDLTWDDLVEQGIAHRFLITNADTEAAFAGTLWEDDDPDAKDDPDGAYLDLWIIDIGPDSVAAAVLDDETLAARETLMAVSDHDEPILLLANGRHGLVSEDFVRNTSPDLLFLHQGDLPLALRDGDIEVELAEGVPDFEHRMIVRADRRMGFNPIADWQLTARATRRHGAFMPEIGIQDFTSVQAAPAKFFRTVEKPKPRPIWVESILARKTDLIILGVFLAGLVAAMLFGMNRLAAMRFYTPLRLGVLAFVLVFIGWWGQGQLSIVTVIGTLRTGVEGGSFAFLLYDPFSLVIWGVALLSLLYWGRGLFCGWLCPFGALQEFAHHIGKALHLPQIRVSERWDTRLKWIKYGALAVLIGTAFWPTLNDTLVEVEPFKTSITVGFDREWIYVSYAAFWLLLGLVVFKSFCRYLCPLGAFLALGGLLRRRDWIARRVECGSPCQLCKVRCKYGAIEPSGAVRYDECFQCLDCVTIHDDKTQCVPLILAARRETA
jgi:transcriptional regulator of nitric oxide reductase